MRRTPLTTTPRRGEEADLVDFEQGCGGGEQHDGVQRDERDDVDERLGELGRREVEHNDGDEAARQHQDPGEEAAMRLLQDLRSMTSAALLRCTTHNTRLVNLTNSKKVKFSHTRYRALGPQLIPVYRQSARR